MILVKPSYKILSIMNAYDLDSGDAIDSLDLIELAGRTCYKSEDKINESSRVKFVQKINDLGHESVLEHSCMTVKFICDRGVSHELVRHRLASYSQESTRYCNYSGGVTFVINPEFPFTEGEYKFVRDSMIRGAEEWMSAMLSSEETYLWMIEQDIPPQIARSVLPNSLKTEIVVTANFREWRHIFKLRCSEKAHPQMRELIIPLRDECRNLIPIIFD